MESKTQDYIQHEKYGKIWHNAPDFVKKHAKDFVEKYRRLPTTHERKMFAFDYMGWPHTWKYAKPQPEMAPTMGYIRAELKNEARKILKGIADGPILVGSSKARR